jgi:hypothetical protein
MAFCFKLMDKLRYCNRQMNLSDSSSEEETPSNSTQSEQSEYRTIRHEYRYEGPGWDDNQLLHAPREPGRPVFPIPPVIEIALDPNAPRNRPPPRKFFCSFHECAFRTTRWRSMEAHTETMHECSRCGDCFDDINLHQCTHSMEGGWQNQAYGIENVDPGLFKLTNILHRGGMYTYERDIKEPIVDLEQIFGILDTDVTNIVTGMLQIHRNIQISLCMFATLERTSDKTELQRKFISPFQRVTHQQFLNNKFVFALAYMEASLSLYEHDGSGWRIKSIDKMSLRILPYDPQLTRQQNHLATNPTGGSYIPLPSFLKRKGILNIQTYTNRCFMLSVLAQFYREEIELPDEPGLKYAAMNKSQRRRLKRLWQNPCSYDTILEKVNGTVIHFDGFESTVSLEDITHFERLNKMCVNVYMIDGKKIYPIRITEEDFQKHVDLLLLEETSDGEKKGHFTLITELGRFLGKSGYHKMDLCRYCFQHTSESTSKHRDACLFKNAKKITVPKVPVFKFKKYHAHMDVNFKIVFKMVRYNKPYTIFEETVSRQFTNHMKQTDVAGYYLAVIDPNWNLFFEETYFGGDPMEMLISRIHEKSQECIKLVNEKYVPLKLSAALKRHKKDITNCELCHKAFDDETIPAFNHHHYTGEFKSLLCVQCNILVVKKAVVCICHTLGKEEGIQILRQDKTRQDSASLVVGPTN